MVIIHFTAIKTITNARISKKKKCKSERDQGVKIEKTVLNKSVVSINRGIPLLMYSDNFGQKH